MLPYHPGTGVGTHSDHGLDACQRLVKALTAAGYPRPQPHRGQANEVGGEESELFLQSDAAPGAHLEWVHLEDDVGFFDAGLNGLAPVVEVEPSGQGEMLPIIPVDDQGAVLLVLRRVKAFQGHRQGVGTVVDVLFVPGDHVCILANSSPTVARLDLVAESGCHLGIEGFGVDDVAHLNQPGEVGTGAKASIQAQDDRNRLGVVLIVAPQPVQVRFEFGAFGLQWV